MHASKVANFTWKVILRNQTREFRARVKVIKCLMEETGIQGSTLGVPIWYAARIGPKGCTLGVLVEYAGRTRPG